MTPPRVAVIVLNWNGGAHLAPCLDSVAALTWPDREVLVVDNASTDGSAAGLEARHPDFRVLRLARNTGYAGGNNAGIRSTTGAYVLLVNNDTVLSPGTLEPLIALAEADGQVAACSPCITYFDRSQIINAAGIHLLADAHPVSRGRSEPATRYQEVAEVFGAHGACVLYRRAALDHVGLLDEDFFAYHEEFDLAWRLRLAGYRAMYAPAARVLHHEALSLRGQPERILHLMERNRIWALVKNAGPSFLVHALPALARGEYHMLRHCLGMRTATPLAARADAFLGLGRMLAKRRAVQRLRVVPDSAIELWIERGSGAGRET